MRKLNPDIIKYAPKFLSQLSEKLIEEMEYTYEEDGYNFEEEMIDYPVAALIATTTRSMRMSAEGEQIRWIQGIIEQLGYGDEYVPQVGYGWNVGQLGDLKRKIENDMWGDSYRHNSWLFTESRGAKKFGFINWMEVDPFEQKVKTFDVEEIDHSKSGVCDRVALKKTIELVGEGRDDFKIIEGAIWTHGDDDNGTQYPTTHVWIEFDNGEIYDPSIKQFDKWGGVSERISEGPIRDAYYKWLRDVDTYTPSEWIEWSLEHPKQFR